VRTVNRSRPLPSRPLLLLLRVVGAGLLFSVAVLTAESTSATLFWPSVFVEAAGAVVLAVLAALTFLATRTPERTPERIRSG
jgi:protein-S-isoprenylcysteine O-methyltransferase Ste14